MHVDTGSIPNKGSKIPHAIGQLSPCAKVAEPALEPASRNYWSHMPRACAPQQQKPLQWGARTPQQRVVPHSPPLEKAHAKQSRLSAAKNK